VTELRNQPTAGFKKLKGRDRRLFVARHYGFLKQVMQALAACGVNVSLATVSRTWYGDFKKPNPVVVAALDEAYQGIVRRRATAA
jgi:hypothetical protein